MLYTGTLTASTGFLFLKYSRAHLRSLPGILIVLLGRGRTTQIFTPHVTVHSA